MKTVRIAGVPEHFNLPFYQLSEAQNLEAEGVSVDWLPNSSGTGAILADLEAGKADLAVILTEGGVLDQQKGSNNTIVSHYVKSPLVWGVHTHSQFPWSIRDGISSKTRIAISRLNSGSHLMAFLYAEKFGCQLSDDQFLQVGNMDGALAAMAQGKADIFLWEKFTTKPLVDAGDFLRVDECPTPWEPFVIVSRTRFYQENRKEVDGLLTWLKERVAELKANPVNTKSQLVERFGLQEADVDEWFKNLVWEVTPVGWDGDFTQVAEVLQRLKLI